MKKKMVVACVLVICALGVALVSAQDGVKKKRPLPHDYGKVVINNFSERANMAPVVFDHWLHRSKYTCRLCHVDLAFGMKAGSTGIRAADNMKGYYCGTCHNGNMAIENRKVFESCAKTYSTVDERKRCDRCHSQGKSVNRQYDFYAYTEKFPKERFGNGIDWEKAEATGQIKLIDYIEGVSIKKSSLAVVEDFALEPKVKGMPEIIFSHKKHTVWNGCEVCHPEIFVGVKKGNTTYSMVEIFQGKYCGVCHVSVAFPLLDCQRCHTKQVG